MRRRLIPIAACLLIAVCAAIFFAGSPAFSGSPSADTLLPTRTAILPPNGLLQEGDWVFRHGTATDTLRTMTGRPVPSIWLAAIF